MIDISDLKKYDVQIMYEFYDKWPKIASDSYNSDLECVDFNNISNIVFCGMGGSGAIGDLISAIMSKTNIPTIVIKGYLLPKTVNSNSLVIVTSISGNTFETLSVLNLAKEIGCKIIAFSSGGKIEEYCSKNKLEFRKIPQFHSPRASFPSFLFSMLKVLDSVIPVKTKDVSETINQLTNQNKLIASKNLSDSNPALSLAYWIKGIPLMYYPWGLQASAIRFKNSFQENSKLHTITENVIESCHNGIVSWEIPSVVQPILLQGVDDYIKTKERWIILKEYFTNKQIDFREVFSVNGNILSKLVNLVYLFDYASIYKAILNEIDPSPIIPIDFIKSRL